MQNILIRNKINTDSSENLNLFISHSIYTQYLEQINIENKINNQEKIGDEWQIQ